MQPGGPQQQAYGSQYPQGYGFPPNLPPQYYAAYAAQYPGYFMPQGYPGQPGGYPPQGMMGAQFPQQPQHLQQHPQQQGPSSFVQQPQPNSQPGSHVSHSNGIWSFSCATS